MFYILKVHVKKLLKVDENMTQSGYETILSSIHFHSKTQRVHV
mgnify:FL=1